MKDPRRMCDDAKVPVGTRELIASAALPRLLPSEVRARSGGSIRREVRRRQRQRIAWGVTATAAAALAMLLVARRFSVVLPEKVSNQLEPPSVSGPLSAEPRAVALVPPCSGCRLVPSSAGWLDRRTNRWGAQGAFYVDASAGSTVLQPARPARHEAGGWLWRNQGDGRLCLKGVSAAVLNGDFKNRWGVVGGVELCDASTHAETPDQTFAITQCPWGDLADLAGVRFDLEGPDIPSEVRVVFSETDSKENAFVILYDAAAGRHEVRMDEARVSYQQPPRPARRDHVRGVEWLIPSRLGKPAYFDFCVTDIELF